MITEREFNLIKRTFATQNSQFYCGLACLTSLVRYYGGETSQEKLRDVSGTTLQGTNMVGLIQSGQALGFEVKPFGADIVDLREIESPVILHILKDNKFEHYVVCYGLINEKFIIGDPGLGIVEFSEEELSDQWKSKVLLMIKPLEGFVKIKTYKKNMAKWFWKLIKDDLPILIVAALMGLFISILGLSIAVYIQKLIDKILPSADRGLLIKSLAIFIAILLAKAFLGYIRGILLVRQSRDINIRVVSSFFSKLLFLPKNFFDCTPTGDMIGRLNDSQRIQRVIISLSSNVLIDIFVIVSSITYIFILSPSTGLISLLSIPLFGLLAWKYNRRIIFKQREVMQTYALTESKYIDTLQGISVLKTGNLENLLAKIVQNVYNIFQGKVLELGILGNRISLWTQILSIFLISIIVIWTSFLRLGEKLLIGQMMAIITIAGNLINSVVSVAMANIQIQEAKIAFERMYEFSAARPEYGEEDYTTPINIELEVVELRNLSYRFPGKKLLLEDINMKFEKGKISTIFGEIGCGKSTIISILQRFYPFESGKISINGDDWSCLNIPAWRNLIGVVSQHVKLFNGTIFENICIQERFDIQDVTKFCQETGFETFINEFQQGYSTIINENGTNLSGGQQQLIALAHALYHKPKVLFLDEATAAMDRRTEKFVLNLLKQKKEEMIIIFVTHRVQLARRTDQIYVIENRRIAASGTHDKLVEINRLYREACEDIS